MLPPEGCSSRLDYPASHYPPEELFPAHRSDFRVDSATVTRAPGLQMDPESVR